LAYITNRIHTLYGRGLIRPVAPQNTEQDYHRPDFIITIPELS
jgi:hypothetical protein